MKKRGKPIKALSTKADPPFSAEAKAVAVAFEGAGGAQGVRPLLARFAAGDASDADRRRLAQILASLPGAHGEEAARRRAERDAIARDYADRFWAGSVAATAGALLSEARRVGATPAGRAHRIRETAPLEWQGTSKEIAMLFLRACGDEGLPEPRTLRRILANLSNQKETVGHRLPLGLASAKREHDAVDSPAKGGAMFAITERELVEGAREHPIGREIIASALAPKIKARQALADELRKLDADEATDWPKREKAWSKALERFEAAQLAFRKAEQERDAAITSMFGPSNAYSARRQHIEGELRRTADSAAIDSFIGDMANEIHTALKAYRAHQEEAIHPVTREHTRRVDTNGASVQARVSAIKAAMESAAALRLEPDQSKVPVRLAELRAALPTIDTVLRPPAPPAT